MARFFGKVGYGVPSELVDGVWSDTIKERAYKGEILNETAAHVESDKVNENVRFTQRISIVADPYAFENFTDIKYVEVAGSLRAVSSVQVERPRLILSVGGAYNGTRPTPSVPGDS
jgi:hypothetical protein